jgi:hypothetical protein
MKNFSLIFLICFSLALEGADAGAAAAQTYSNSANHNINTVRDNLLSLNSELNGMALGPNSRTSGLLSNLEWSLCGANVDLDQSGNITNNGLIIDTAGNYTNCNGGAAASYEAWANNVTCWQKYIQGLTNNADWKDAYDICAVDTGVINDTADNCVLSGNFYSNSVNLANLSNAVFNQITNVIGCSAVAAVPAVAATAVQL